MTDYPEKPNSIPERALGQMADEFATAAKGAGKKLGEEAEPLEYPFNAPKLKIIRARKHLVELVDGVVEAFCALAKS